MGTPGPTPTLALRGAPATPLLLLGLVLPGEMLRGACLQPGQPDQMG